MIGNHQANFKLFNQLDNRITPL